MKLRHLSLAIALAIVIGFCMAPMTTHANVTSLDRTAAVVSCSADLDSSSDRVVTGPKCIPCSPKHPCVNPLTICTYSGSSTHGCCLGYAGAN